MSEEMQRFKSKINEVGMITLPEEVCKALKLKTKSVVAILAEDKKITLQKCEVCGENAITRKVDELHRIVLPKNIRQLLHVKTDDTLFLELEVDKVTLKSAEPVDIVERIAEVRRRINLYDLRPELGLKKGWQDEIPDLVIQIIIEQTQNIMLEQKND